FCHDTSTTDIYTPSLHDALPISDILARIESEYGVNRYDVLGVWGVESDFGTKLGKKDVVESLATLSCFGRRQSYFRGEYVSALKDRKSTRLNSSHVKISYAVFCL